MAWRVMGSRVARSVAVAGPCAASAASSARRLGSASAVKTCSATASTSGGIEVRDQLAELSAPAVDVAAERRAVRVGGQLGEAGLDDRQAGARAGGFERDLDVGAAEVVLGQAVDA